MRKRLLGTACAAVSFLAVAGASADTITVDDNRNVRGNLLDIQSASAGHRGKSIQHTITTYHGWRSSELRSTSSQPRTVAVYIWDARRASSAAHDYEVFARFRNGRLRGTVIKTRPRKRVVGHFPVRRLDRHSISFAFAPKLIGSPRRYKWQSITGFTGKGCPKVPKFQFGCDDSAPTGGARLHDLTLP